MRIRAGGIVLGVLFLGTTVPAIAEPISILSVTQKVIADGQQRSGDSAMVAIAGDATSPTLTSAGLISQVGTDGFGAFGFSSSVQNESATGGFGQATFGVQFEVTDAQRFSFGALFATLGNDAMHESFWSASLIGAGGTLFDFAGSNTRSFLTDGLLTPGIYDFVVMSSSLSRPQFGDAWTRGGFVFGLDFTNVAVSSTPEPASLLLLGTGAALIARRKMKRA